MKGTVAMVYEVKPLSCDPAKLKGLSGKLIVSYYENNYGGAVKAGLMTAVIASSGIRPTTVEDHGPRLG
jgi:superoxide dismutase, Fe-Mn family